MIYAVSGTLRLKADAFCVIEVSGISLKIKTSVNTLKSLPQPGASVKLLTHLHVREDALELFGFGSESELELFEMLIGISGIGPKSALGILGIETVENLRAAISEGRAELLTKCSGIGKKTADRVVLELRNKVFHEGSAAIVGLMESDRDIVDALGNLGYSKAQARAALANIDPAITGTEARIKAALKILKAQ